MLFAYSPAACASRSNATELYHPAEPVRSASLGFSKNTPIVAAPPANAGTIREASP